MCRCNSEEAQECDEMLAKARALVTHSDTTISDLDFVDRMLYSLGVEGTVEIMADQWAGVSFKQYKIEEGKAVQLDPYDVQCDSIVDGIAACLVHRVASERNLHVHMHQKDGNTIILQAVPK